MSLNNAIYVETNRDAVESVFIRLKEQYKDVYRQPNSMFMYDYIDLKETCVIVKPLVTESPLMDVDGIKVPTLEKLLLIFRRMPTSSICVVQSPYTCIRLHSTCMPSIPKG